jgi:hypothetical protein
MTKSELFLLEAITRADLSVRPYTREAVALHAIASDFMSRRGYLCRAGAGRAWVLARCRVLARDLNAALDAAQVPAFQFSAPRRIGGAA